MSEHTAFQIVCASNVALLAALGWALVQIRYWKARYAIEKDHREKMRAIDKDHIYKLQGALKESFEKHKQMVQDFRRMAGLDPFRPIARTKDGEKN